ncbi:MAG: thiopeptide-type bacteriocin biosynthesis protein, partial [Daejeonella sp.]|uniref:thiopeptide-type bacteriocin biosynthesis protein n=1 Tax=Daejeonella sp. TaxID=2805397 RepID=UPI003C737AE3
ALSEMRNMNKEDQIKRFQKLAEKLELPKEFSYEVHDHLLHIDQTSHKDMELLLATAPATGRIILREYLPGQELLVKDGDGNGYAHEFIAFLTNRETSYQSSNLASYQWHQIPVNKERIFPFDDWFFLKIYLHPVGYSDLLVDYIRPFILENFRNGNISSWFFISFFDEDFHLRLRLKLIPGGESHVACSFIKLEAVLRALPNIKKLELSTYFPEYERYASIGIQSAEKLFEQSSEIVISELTSADLVEDVENHILFSGLRHLLMVCQAMEFNLTEIDQITRGFSHRLAKAEKVALDMEIRYERQGFYEYLIDYQEKKLSEHHYLVELQKATQHLAMDAKLQVIIDINHMHLNRLFLSDQKYLEEKCYYFLRKVWKGINPKSSFSPMRKFCSST